MKLHYENPRKIKGSYIWNVHTKFISDEDLTRELNTSLDDKKLLQKLAKKYGDKLFLASGGEKNKFFVWFSRIKKWDNQKNVKVQYNIQPKSSRDIENNNMIDFFDFSVRLNKRFKLKIDFNFDAYETRLDVGHNKIKKYDKNSALYKRYTKSEKYLEQTKAIKSLAKRIVGKEKDYYRQARKIFDWILDNISYTYPPEERGAIPTLKNKCGDCGEFSLLFIALCRSLGIPARSVVGMWALPKDDYHAWAEFYLEGVGWVPVDASIAQEKDKGTKNPVDPNYYFGNLDNERIIFSKGNNILLKNCPKKLSEFELMEDCRTLFMQPTAIYPFIDGNKKGMFIIDITELNIVKRNVRKA